MSVSEEVASIPWDGWFVWEYVIWINMSLRLWVGRKATRGVEFEALAQRWKDWKERMLKCLWLIDDIEPRAGMSVITRGPRLAWLSQNTNPVRQQTPRRCTCKLDRLSPAENRCCIREKISLELIHANRDSVGKVRKTHLIQLNLP